MSKINIVCVAYGSKYTMDYVQTLYNMVSRNITKDFKFICFSDNNVLKRNVSNEIEVRQFPRHDFNGWFNKLQLFNPENGLEGVSLYFDLDVVILENIDCFCEFGEDNTFAMLNEFNLAKWYQSSIMKFDIRTANRLVYAPYILERTKFRKHHGDQTIITELVKKQPESKNFPNEWTFSAKWYDRKRPRFHKTKWTFERYPNTKVAVFHGKPDPHELKNKEIRWVVDNWK